jgi:hypothetical protein
MDSITYSVFGKNDLIFSRNLLVSGARSYNFKILTTIAMLPYSYIIVYLIRPNGEILSDKIEIKFQNELPNMVGFKFLEIPKKSFLKKSFLIDDKIIL